MSPTGPYIAGTVTDVGANPGVAAWTNPNNAKVLDASTADFPYFQGVTTNLVSNPLQFTNFGFNLPSTAVIDSVIVYVTRSGIQVTEAVHLLKAGVLYGSNLAFFSVPTSLATFPFQSAGSEAASLTPSDINNSGFGVQLDSTQTHDPADSSYHVDSVSISVNWHTAPVAVEKRYLYKVYSSVGRYLGNIPNVTSEFNLSQNINTIGSQITVTSSTSVDTSGLATDVVTDEAGNILTDESSNPMSDEGRLPIVGRGEDVLDAIIKNGNRVKVYEYSYWHPQGKCMFIGVIENWKAGYGDTYGDQVTMLIYSDGQDLNQYPVRGYPYTYTTDQSQTSQNSVYTISTSYPTYNIVGQTFKVGAGITNLGAISLMLNGVGYISIALWDSPAKAVQYANGFASIVLTTPTETQIAFYLQANVTPGQTLFLEVNVEDGSSLSVYYQNTDVYSFGTMYTSVFGGGGGGAWTSVPGSDLYFKTFQGTGSTTATFSALDPAAQTLPAILGDYNSRGGLITLGTSNAAAYTIPAIKFNTASIYEGIQTLLKLCPSNFYFVVDVGQNTLTFAEASDVAEFTLIKGVHIDGLELSATIEQVVNNVLLTGGFVAGANIYVSGQDADSSTRYGPRLDRPSNNSVIDAPTGAVVVAAQIAALKDEQFQTTVQVLDKYIDTSLMLPGKMIGFRGFGTFVDSLVIQIVRREYAPESSTLTLGILPKRLTPSLDQTVRQLIAASTVDNPTAPS